MAFEWKDRYQLGIAEVDKQHKRLFEIGARVYDLALLNDSYDHYDEVMALLNELLEYTEYHFGFEEDMMKRYNYNDLEKQEQEHGFYTKRIRDISPEEVDNTQNQTIIQLVDFLSEWISSHILLSDRKYAAYFKENGIEI